MMEDDPDYPKGWSPFDNIPRDDSLFNADMPIFAIFDPTAKRQPVGGRKREEAPPASAAKPEQKSAAKPEQKSGPKPEQKSTAKPEQKPAAKPEQKPAAQRGPTPAPDGSLTFKPDYWFDGEAMMNGALSYITSKRGWKQMLDVSGGGTKQQLITVPIMRRQDVFASYWDSYHKDERINPRNAWFQVRFLHHRLIVTHLQVALGRAKPNQWPHSWMFIASNNEREWDTLIEEKCTSTLKPCKERIPCKTVNIPRRTTTAYAGFRFVMINGCPPGSRDDCLLSLSGFELYGRLLPV